jgi:hypothetical protein
MNPGGFTGRRGGSAKAMECVNINLHGGLSPGIKDFANLNVFNKRHIFTS